jgi:hypothetical protein
MRKLPVVPTCRTPARLPPPPDTLHFRRHPGPARGAYALSSRNVGREAMDARRALDESALSRTAKSCGSDIPTLISSWPRCFRIVACDGGKKARSPGSNCVEVDPRSARAQGWRYAPPPSAADGLDPVRSPVCWLCKRSVANRAPHGALVSLPRSDGHPISHGGQSWC